MEQNPGALRFGCSSKIPKPLGIHPVFSAWAPGPSQSRADSLWVSVTPQKGGKWENAGFWSGKLWGAVSGGGGSTATRLSLTWCLWRQLWDVAQAPPVLLAAPEAQHSWVSHSQHLDLLSCPPLPSLGIPGFLICWDLGACSPSTMRVTGLSLSVASALVASPSCAPPPSSFGVPGLGYPKCVPLGALVWHRGSTRSWPGKLREFWAVP